MSKYLLLTIYLLSATCYANADIKVQVGDLIRVALPGEASLNGEFAVDKRGRVILPEVGAIEVANLSEQEMKITITKELRKVFQDLSNLNVYIHERRLLIYVYGYVENPGPVVLPNSANIQMALREAGGLRIGAQLDKLQLHREQKTTVFDYKAYLNSGSNRTLPELRSLDTLFIPSSPITGNIEVEFDPAKQSVAGDASESKLAVKIFGEVNSPGLFSYKEGSTLIDVLMLSGGVTRYAGVEQIRVINNNVPSTFNLKRYLDTGNAELLPSLQQGATVFVPRQEEEIKAGSNTVYVMGEVFKPGAYEGKAGATFMDVLANAGGPTRFAESRQIKIIKSSGKVIPFDMTAYADGTVTNIPSIGPGDAIFIPEKTDINEKSWLKISPNRAVNVIGEVEKPGRYEWSNEMSLLDLLAHAGGPTSKADTSTIEMLIPQGKQQQKVIFNLDSYIKSSGQSQALPTIIAGTVIRVHELPLDPMDNKSQWVRQSADKSIYIFGQVGSPGRYRFTNDMSFLDLLSAADGPTQNADIRNIRVSHRGEVKAKVSKLDLAMYFETGDENLLPDIKTGDSIYIPEKDRMWLSQSKETTIRVLGAVNSPGRYQFNDTMTILDLLAEAGGPTDNAYLEKITVVNVSCCKDQATSFDLLEFSRTANFTKLPLIRVGDTIYIPNKDDSSLVKARESLTDIFQMVSIAVLLGLL
ncbi:SLBB domain-containing protein [Aliivibrio kagoshimensis]|uniref:SLBB domain-containing protein n=1 Tax=Aliivibrio kagoshimensis TaxID=2910230 RepID=UPI003D0D6B99